MSRGKVLTILLILALIGLLFYLMLSPEKKHEKLEISSTNEDVLNDIEETKKYVEKTTEWMHKQDKEGEISYFHPPEESGQEKKEPKKEVIKYFIAGLTTGDIDIFLSSFYTQTISEDLFVSDNPDKMQVAQEIINKITRDGTIREFNYEDVKGVFNTDTNKVSLVIVYEDGQKAKVDIETIPLQDSHGEHSQKVYVITTSAWEIIEQIESHTK